MLETKLEKIARILARRFNLEVVLEGTRAMTDGRRITLPNFPDPGPELLEDLEAFLDHEVGHCMFTTFSEFKAVTSRFHAELLNGVEDVRMERLMGAQYPGSHANLRRLNARLDAQNREQWTTLPWPVRLIFSVMDLMEGVAPHPDPEIARHLAAVQSEVAALNRAGSTGELRQVTERMVALIKADREAEQAESRCQPHQPENPSGPAAPGSPAQPKAAADGMLHDRVGTPSRFDRFAVDVESHMQHRLVREMAAEGRRQRSLGQTGAAVNLPHLPLATTFDTVTDLTGKGDRTALGALRQQVRPVVGALVRNLELKLKAAGEPGWQTGQSWGTPHPRQLHQMATGGDGRVFRHRQATAEGRPVLLLLVDQSGSMRDKLPVTKQAVAAFADALNRLGIDFEISGFASQVCPELKAMAERTSPDLLARYNRTEERLDLTILKRFGESQSCGMTRLKSGGNTPTGEALAWAGKRLEGVPATRRVLFVFTDGQPFGKGNHDILAGHARREVTRLENSGVEVVGIGIRTNVEHLFPKAVQVNDLNTLPQAVIRELTGILTSPERPGGAKRWPRSAT